MGQKQLCVKYDVAFFKTIGIMKYYLEYGNQMQNKVLKESKVTK